VILLLVPVAAIGVAEAREGGCDGTPTAVREAVATFYGKPRRADLRTSLSGRQLRRLARWVTPDLHAELSVVHAVLERPAPDPLVKSPVRIGPLFHSLHEGLDAVEIGDTTPEDGGFAVQVLGRHASPLGDGRSTDTAVVRCVDGTWRLDDVRHDAPGSSLRRTLEEDVAAVRR
jgi:hypothetical protein